MQGDGVGEVEPRSSSFAVSQSKKNISLDKNKYPKGWNQKRVQEVIDHVESRTEGETIAEDETAFEQGYTAMQVPHKLVPIVRQLIVIVDEKSDISI